MAHQKQEFGVPVGTHVRRATLVALLSHPRSITWSSQRTKKIKSQERRDAIRLANKARKTKPKPYGNNGSAYESDAPIACSDRQLPGYASIEQSEDGHSVIAYQWKMMNAPGLVSNQLIPFPMTADVKNTLASKMAQADIQAMAITWFLPTVVHTPVLLLALDSFPKSPKRITSAIMTSTELYRTYQTLVRLLTGLYSPDQDTTEEDKKIAAQYREILDLAAKQFENGMCEVISSGQRFLEQAAKNRPAIPADPAVSFLDWLTQEKGERLVFIRDIHKMRWINLSLTIRQIEYMLALLLGIPGSTLREHDIMMPGQGVARESLRPEFVNRAREIVSSSLDIYQRYLDTEEETRAEAVYLKTVKRIPDPEKWLGEDGVCPLEDTWLRYSVWSRLAAKHQK
jgi:hypothetical protein